MRDILTDWSWPTAVTTAVLLPVLVALGVVIRRAILKWSRYALDGCLYFIGKYITHQLASTLTLRRYATLQLAGRSGKLFVPAREDIILDIDHAYIPLTLEGPLADKRYDHTTATQCGTRIRVIGEPGSGKSTIMKRLFRDECLRSLKRATATRFPILYELKHLHPPDDKEEQELGDWFLGLLQSDLKKTEVFNMADCIESFLSHAGVLLLLDGADEINSSIYPRAEQAIRGLSNRLRQLSENNIIIVTMRTQFYQQTRYSLAEEFPYVIEAKPFSPSDIYRFLGIWPFKDSAQEHRARIYADLLDRPTLRDMCANPLVLSMYVAEDQLSSHPLVPETRTDFYGRVTEELLIRRRATQVGAPIGALRLREQRERFLGQLAFDHMRDETQPPNLIRWEDAVRVAREVFRCKRAEAEERVQAIARDTGLISEERPRETMRFIHLTFCEFLAAAHSRRGRRAGWEELLVAYRVFTATESSVASSRLDQVIPFAAGLAPSYHIKQDAISDLGKLGNMRLLALAFLETKQYEHPEWVTFCKERVGNLLASLEQHPTEAWLEELHLFAVVSKDFRVMSTDSASLSTIEKRIGLDDFCRRLASAGSTALHQILRLYASRDAGAAFRIAALCNVDIVSELPDLIAENCDDPAVLALAVEAAKSETQRVAIWADVLAAAALRSETAAQWLSKASLGAEWGMAVDLCEARARWDKVLGDRNALSDVFTIAYANEERRCRLREVELLTECPSPRSLVDENAFNQRSALMIALLMACGVVEMMSSSLILEKDSIARTWGFTAATFITYSLMAVWWMMLARLMLFRRLVSICRGDLALGSSSQVLADRNQTNRTEAGARLRMVKTAVDAIETGMRSLKRIMVARELNSRRLAGKVFRVIVTCRKGKTRDERDDRVGSSVQVDL